MQLKGKVAIVTGASRGLGRQIALALASEGADVVVAARTVEPRRSLPGTIGETVAQIEAVGRRAIAVAADMTVADDLDRVIDAASSQLGRLDILVNNAAYTAGRAWGLPLDQLSRDDWIMQFDTNVHAPFSLIKAAVPHMRAQGGGIIVNITSASSELAPLEAGGGAGTFIAGSPPLAYGASKAALNRLSNALAPQLWADGIAIVTLEPGFVLTEMVQMMADKGLDASAALPMSLPASVVMQIVTDDDPLRYTGQILHARDFA